MGRRDHGQRGAHCPRSAGLRPGKDRASTGNTPDRRSALRLCRQVDESVVSSQWSCISVGNMRIALINQTFYPDVVSTGQHLSDLALHLAARGHEVTVVTSRRAYDDPEKVFPKQETWRGVRIRRVFATGFGKRAKWRRAADFASFLGACCWRLLRLPRQDVMVAMTSPPLVSFVGAWYCAPARQPVLLLDHGFEPGRSPGRRLARRGFVCRALAGAVFPVQPSPRLQNRGAGSFHAKAHPGQGN